MIRPKGAQRERSETFVKSAAHRLSCTHPWTYVHPVPTDSRCWICPDFQRQARRLPPTWLSSSLTTGEAASAIRREVGSRPMASKPGPAAVRSSGVVASLDCELSSCLTTRVLNPTDEGQLIGWNGLHLTTVHRGDKDLPGLWWDLVGVDRKTNRAELRQQPLRFCSKWT